MGRRLGAWLGLGEGGRTAGQDAAQLVARADLELDEHLAQVVLDGARADEQPGADLLVREPVAGELDAHASTAEPLDRLAVQALRGLAVAAERYR
jgi:hypothetical protein